MERLTKSNAYAEQSARAFVPASDEPIYRTGSRSLMPPRQGHFRDLNGRLATNKWLIDGSFTLADVAWTPQVHRMSLMEWPTASYPHLSRWYAQLQMRPSFQEAVVDCEPPGARAMFASYAAQRRSEGTSVADMLNKSAA